MTIPICFAALIAVLAAVEVVFRIVHRRRYGHPYHVSIKFPWKRSYVEPHPFLSFAYKRNEAVDRNQKLPYELHPHRFRSFHVPLRLNNLGHFGPDFTPDKPAGTLRIACLGASTTANNIADDQRDYSYPILLRDGLDKALASLRPDGRVEVLNCGIGGWVSADILINFLLNIVHLKPDYVIVYHAFNDLHLHLMEDFQTDYSHGRLNLGEVLWRIRRAYRFPKIPWWHSYEWLKDRLLGTGNVRNDVLRLICRQFPRIDRPFAALEVEQQNFRSLLAVCRHHGIRVILSSFCHYGYDTSRQARRYGEGVAEENARMRALADEFGLPFVDQAALIPAEPDYFVDAIHFTPTGMQALAGHFRDAVLADLERHGWPDGTPGRTGTGVA
jgi:lysophospholipase L1-like esterase